MPVFYPAAALCLAATLNALLVTPVVAQEAGGGDSSPESAALPAEMEPLFDRIRDAKSTRATVELSAETIIDGAVVASEKSVYQVASTAPDRFTVYLKNERQRTRIYCDGENATVAMSPESFARLQQPIAMQQAVFGLPVAMGPYPEVVLALTLAGIDPGLTLATGMKSLELAGREKFRGRTPSLRFEGVQDDDVSWELWVTPGDNPKPLRMRADLTAMLRANGELDLPASYHYVLRLDFTTWKIDTSNADSLYRYTTIESATEYDSVQAYYQQQAEAQEPPE